jgi:hypothetical membrane protein
VKLRSRVAVPLAGVIWICWGCAYFLLEALAAHRFIPVYSYARNYISDLGSPDCGFRFQGRMICSPLHSLMNLNFLAEGLALFFGVLALSLAEAPGGQSIMRDLWLSVFFAGGLILVGTLPESAEALVNGAGVFHVLGACLAIVCGNVFWLNFRIRWELKLPIFLRLFLRFASVAGLAGFSLLLRSQLSRRTMLVADGILERLAADTIVVCQILSGGWLLSSVRQRI